jgi:hypothetical protein
MPGVTHWQHNRFHAYFPAGNSYPSILGDLVSSGLGIVGFTWAASPACTELETICLDWLGRMLNLPKMFLPFNYESLKEQLTNGHSTGSNSLNDLISEEEEEDQLDNDQRPGFMGGGVLLVSQKKSHFYLKVKRSQKKLSSVFKGISKRMCFGFFTVCPS